MGVDIRFLTVACYTSNQCPVNADAVESLPLGSGSSTITTTAFDTTPTQNETAGTALRVGCTSRNPARPEGTPYFAETESVERPTDGITSKQKGSFQRDFNSITFAATPFASILTTWRSSLQRRTSGALGRNPGGGGIRKWQRSSDCGDRGGRSSGLRIPSGYRRSASGRCYASTAKRGF